MKIITVPNPHLRQTAQPIQKVDKKIKQFLSELEQTLVNKKNPQGVGLAAPQVDVTWRAFVTQLTEDGKREDGPVATKVYINPEIIAQSPHQILGPTEKEETLEGCLSIPGVYGPVPRYEWIRLRYQKIVDDELLSVEERYEHFAARVIQHETDHLNGILFIDYSLKYDLPLYKENPRNKKLYEIDRDMAEAFIHQTQ